MANKNGKITEPVRITDVKEVLGVSENKLSSLCKHPNVNMWSKNKPAKSTGNVINGYPHCGIVINKANHPKDAAVNWTFSEAGGGNGPFRLGYFKDYDHKSMPFLYIANTVDCTKDLKYGSMYIWSIYNHAYEGNTNDGNLTVLDWKGKDPDLTTLYPCVYLEKGNLKYIVTTEYPTGSDYSAARELAVDFSKIPQNVRTGTYTAYFCLSTVKYNMQSVSDPNILKTFYGVYTPAGCKNPIRISVTHSPSFSALIHPETVRGGVNPGFNNLRPVSNYDYSKYEDVWLKTQQSLTIYCKVSNQTNWQYTLRDHQVKVVINQLNGVTKAVQHQFYSTDKKQINQLVIPGNSSAYMYLYLPIVTAAPEGATGNDDYQHGDRWMMDISFEITGSDGIKYTSYSDNWRMEYNNADF